MFDSPGGEVSVLFITNLTTDEEYEINGVVYIHWFKEYCISLANKFYIR